jgi:RNA dependent RNA polymerase
MKKQRLFKIYSFDRDCIEDGIIAPENLEAQLTTLSDSFLMFALEKYKGEDVVNDQLITEIIKVMLPNNEEEARIEWQQGLEFNGSRYFAWFATTSGMKKEGKNNAGKCETIFIREDCKPFARELEELISLGKFKEIAMSGEEVCINKDILSRVSLVTSSSYMAGNMPNIIVLPQPQYRIIKDYKTVEKVIKQDGEKEVVDYNLIDYHFDDDIDVFDGGGIATTQVFTQIQQELELNYPVEFAIIRSYGFSIKGMITKFDIISYLNEVYVKDTEYCKRVNGEYQLLDMWNEWRTVNDNTILLNESMAKLAKYYRAENGENMDTYQDRLRNANPKYKDIINKLYITKVNKRDEEITEYRRSNYQLINALALSQADLFELIKNDVQSYKKILTPFEKDSSNEWMINADIIRLFFSNIIKGDKEEKEEIEQEIKRVSDNVGTKCEELLNISENFVKLGYVKKVLARLIEKRCRDIAAGKFTVKAMYQYMAPCPISYMNFAMYRNQGEDGLQEGQFYSSACNDGDVRTIARNPLVAYSEVHNVDFVRNERLDKWLSPCRELIYFNQVSDINALLSGSDLDGDSCTILDSEILRRAVVVPQDGRYFVNTHDGKTVRMPYNKENRFLSTYRASGNLIGRIALLAATFNSKAQHTSDFYDKDNDKFISFYNFEFGSEEEKEAHVQSRIDKGELILTWKASDKHREYIRKRFYEYEKEIYIVLFNSQLAIDSPKTLYTPSSDDMKIIGQHRKARFLQYKKNKEEVNDSEYENTFGLLDKVSKMIERDLLHKVESMGSDFRKNVGIIQQKLVNGEYDDKQYPACSEEIKNLYTTYASERSNIDKLCNAKISIEKSQKDEFGEAYWNNRLEWEYQSKIRGINAERRQGYKEIDQKYIVEADLIMSKYDLATVANALGNLRNCSEEYIISLFFGIFSYLNSTLQSDRYVYKKNKDGDITYLGERYSKIPVAATDNSNIVRKLHINEKQRLKAISVNQDIRARILDDGVVSLIESELENKRFIEFEIEANGNKAKLLKDGASMLEVFHDHLQIDNFNLLNCKKVKVELLGKVNSKSLGMTIVEIVA